VVVATAGGFSLLVAREVKGHYFGPISGHVM